jgi:hypothetical protein
MHHIDVAENAITGVRQLSMLSKGFSNSRRLRSTPLVAFVLLGCSGSPLLCQNPARTTTQAQPTMPAPMGDPTLAEVQLRLDLDHDPFPRPTLKKSRL